MISNLGLLLASEMTGITGETGWADYFKVMLILIGLLLAAFLTLRVWMPRLSKLTGPLSNGPIRVCARQTIERNNALYLVAIGKLTLLISSSDAGIQLISKLDIDLDQMPEAQAESVKSRFERLLRSKVRRDGSA